MRIREFRALACEERAMAHHVRPCTVVPLDVQACMAEISFT